MQLTRFSWAALVVALALLTPLSGANARQVASPSETVLAFYSLLREQRYMDGFAYSVYRDAVVGLSEVDLVELMPEFQQTFAAIPEKIEIKGEQVGADTATVFAAFGDSPAVQEVALVKVEGRWLVGDREALEQVQRDKTAFFFNARIHVNQTEVYRILKRIVGSQEVRFQSSKSYAELAELTSQDGLKGDFEGENASGYRFVVSLTPARDAYTVIAIPLKYARTGKLSFFSDGKVVRAADAQGMPVNEQAPVLAEQEIAQ